MSLPLHPHRAQSRLKPGEPLPKEPQLFMKIALGILKMLQESPGTSKRRLRERFDLTPYRLRRALTKIDRGLTDQIVVQDDTHGVWIVDIRPGRCRGVQWMGRENGGFAQCDNKPVFRDGCCFYHSDDESAELAAFQRRIEVLCAPCKPTPHNLGQVNISVLEDLAQLLMDIAPCTFKQSVVRRKTMETLSAAMATARWKDRMREIRSNGGIPHDLFDRHRRSSGNPFEYSLRRHFAILEVNQEATREEVLRAWKRLARRFHPDGEEGDEERMKVINLAKERIFRLRRWD